jgi:hypothetical protein
VSEGREACTTGEHHKDLNRVQCKPTNAGCCTQYLFDSVMLNTLGGAGDLHHRRAERAASAGEGGSGVRPGFAPALRRLLGENKIIQTRREIGRRSELCGEVSDR